MHSALDMRSALGQMLELGLQLGGCSIDSLQGNEAAELGSKLHSVRSHLLVE